MQTRIRNLYFVPMLIGVVVMIGAPKAAAQTLTLLHSFTNDIDGACFPNGDLIILDNSVYGTTAGGGNRGQGTVFKVNPDGTGFTTLHRFPMLAQGTNTDGADPHGVLTLSGNTLYGTAYLGGIGGPVGGPGRGTVFAVNTNGTVFTNLHDFVDVPEGYYPAAGLILSDDTLYGTTTQNGATANANGTIFAINADGTGFTILYSFTDALPPVYTNGDGGGPQGVLVLSGNTLYGTARFGGSSGNGTVFKVGTGGTGFTTLHSFLANPSSNSDGANPFSGLILSGNTLYGTTANGGSSGSGTVFKVGTDGADFTTLHNFIGSDGERCYAGLILSGNTLYGTTVFGGSYGAGTVFALNTDGSGFTNLYSFSKPANPLAANSDGANPETGLALSGSTLYGTTIGGGSEGYGTVFSLSLPPPQLAIILSGQNVVLTWPTNATGFTLQSTTNLLPVIWSTVSPSPVIVNGLYTVTNPIEGKQQFYKLSQ